MTNSRQSFLGASPQGILCIKTWRPSRPSRPSEQLGECFISILPDEVLLEIFSYIPPKDYDWDQRRHDVEEDEEPLPPFPLTSVCRDWQRIYEAVFFREITFTDHYRSRMCVRAYKLLHLLEARPQLRSYPQTFQLVYSRGPVVSRTLAKILEYCNNVRKVTLHTDLSNDSWGVIHAIKNRPLLEDLNLSSGPSISLILEHFNLPRLKHLRLSRYGPGKAQGEPDAPWQRDLISITQQQLEVLLPPHRYHTGNLTSIEFSDPCTPAYVSAHILRLPKRLEELSITWLTHSFTSQFYTRDAIQQLINMHQQSLRRITLGIIPGRNKTLRMPSFANFPCLEELRMSAYDVIRDTPSHVLQSLSAPRLHSLTISFCVEDQHSESARDFGPAQVTWLKEFATLRKSEYPNAKLKKFDIDFNPHDSPNSISPGGEEWPWEHLEQARQAVAELGLVVTYNKCRWTKEEWDKMVQEVKAERAKRGDGRHWIEGYF